MTVAIHVAFCGEFMTASLLADDKGTHTSSCVSIDDTYVCIIGGYSFDTDINIEYETCSHSCLNILLSHQDI